MSTCSKKTTDLQVFFSSFVVFSCKMFKKTVNLPCWATHAMTFVYHVVVFETGGIAGDAAADSVAVVDDAGLLLMMMLLLLMLLWYSSVFDWR